MLPILALSLAGCGHTSGPQITVPPPRPPPILCASIPAEPDVAGALVRPITAEEIAGFDRFLDAELASRLWGREGWGRVRTAKDFLCR